MMSDKKKPAVFYSFPNVFVAIACAMSCLKLLLIHSYRSTDYEVHRNWLAITHSLPLHKWYYEKTSEWTLDYPPFFAFFEYVLSHIAAMFDPAMVNVKNLNYESPSSIFFHKLSVVVTDFLYIYAAKLFCMNCTARRHVKNDNHFEDPKLILGVLLVTNFGLFIIDHIHFQYNGFLFGIWLLSITAIYENRFVMASLHFATLLNFKHIYLYVAPAYGIYLLRVYCFNSSVKDGSVLWRTFSLRRFLVLSSVVVLIFGMSFGPFIHMGQLSQVISRLFPFKRGLCHAYWAPNVWSLYNIADKVLYTAGRYTKLVQHSNSPAAMTGGLVQEFNHAVLPSVKPIATFIVTGVFMVPALIHLWRNPNGPRSFLRCMILCAFTSFLFGWHVHEKAILMVIVPLALLAVEGQSYGRIFIFLSLTGHASLFPLIFTQFEQPILWAGWISSSAYTIHALRLIHCPGSSKPRLLRFTEWLYIYGLLVVLMYYSIGHRLLGLGESLPFLPLLIMSVYCSLGVVYSYIDLYRTVLSEQMIIKVKGN